MKTIILSTNEGERVTILNQVMKGALSFGFVVNKYVKVFDTKKEAQSTIKNHPCHQGKYTYLILNKKQLKALDYLRKQQKGYYKINDFLALK